MNKRKIVKEIINPYMDKNGFTLEKYERGDWSYRKKIDEAFEIISHKEKYQKNVWLDKEFENNAIQTISLPSFAFYE